MSKLEIVKYLLQEIETEEKLLLDYQAKWEEATLKANQDKTEKYVSTYRYFKWEGRNPSKARIQGNVLKCRQLLLEIGRDVKRYGQ